MPGDAMQVAGHAELERLVGGPIDRVERAAWGFTNRTDVVTLAGGERLIVQRYAEPVAAANRLRLMTALGEPLRAAGVPTAQVLRADLDGTAPYALLDELRGVPAQVAAAGDLSDPLFVTIAAQMGALARRIAGVPVDSLGLARLWGDPTVLRDAALGWLGQVGPLLDDRRRGLLRGCVHSVPDLFADRPPVLAHGDFGPANVLVDDEQITGLLDLEFAQLADPLFDIAWWRWLVRFHYPHAHAGSWEAFAAAAGVDLADAATSERIAALQVLRSMEAAVYFGGSRPRVLRVWARRVSQTVAWWHPS